MLRKTLLACGIASSALYVVADVVASRRYSGYSYRDQVVSELMARGAPTRPLMVSLFVPYNLLVAAFAAGVAMSRPRASRATAAMLAGDAVVGAAGLLRYPMDVRGAPPTPRGRMHGPVTGVLSMFITLAIAFGSRLGGEWFRRYSYATMAALVAFGLWTTRDIPRLEAGEPTPGAGIKERVNIYAYLLWVAVLALLLWKESPRSAPRGR